MMKVLVCDPISELGIEILRRDPDIEVDVCLKQTEDQIAAMAENYDAMVVRSETKITKKIMDAAKKLRVVGRAGVGIDNIDVTAATKNGVIVLNTPDGNTISACEHTMAMILSLVRFIPQADQSLRQHLWDRKKYTGIELKGKKIGIFGFGKIGSEVAIRCKAFGMDVLVFDPFVTPERADRFNVTLCDKETIFREADIITVHMPLIDETRNMIAKAQFAMMKPTARVINVARGGIVNEEDLYEAIKTGVIAGAAIDVWTKEPMTEHPLFDLPQVVVTPHLGASTQEAQVNVALDVVEEIKRVLHDLPVHNAVNIPFIDPEIMEKVRPFMNLADKMGKMAAYMAEGPIKAINIQYMGDMKSCELRPLTNTFLKGMLRPSLADAVNYVNAPVVAKERGIKVNTNQTEEVVDYANKIMAEVIGDQYKHVISGTVFKNGEGHIVQIDEFELDIRLDGHVLLVPHKDQPKVVGLVGMILGEAGVNIAGLQLGRKQVGGESLMVLNIDNPVADTVLKEIETLPAVHKASYLNFE
jgi:D-3-phosphoglycerate dehydrogenase